MGRPVIASDLGGPVETVEHGVTGWRVPAGDAGAVAAAIEAALALPAEERARPRLPGARRRPPRLYRQRHAERDDRRLPGDLGSCVAETSTP